MAREHLFATYLIVGCCGLAAAEDSRNRAKTAPAGPDAIPLQTLSTATATISGDGFLSWSGPPLCDQRQNVYLLLVPHWTARPDGRAGAGAALRPRDVLRISSDGKKQTTFKPTADPKFANVDELITIGAALDQHGTLFTLVWARWREGSTQSAKSGQFILSFKPDGQLRSQVEVDPDQILVDKFEVFGSGDFLVRGRRPNSSDPRLAILGSSGRSLQDVRRWSGKFLDDPSPDTPRISTIWCAAGMVASTSPSRIQEKKGTPCMRSPRRVTPNESSSCRGCLGTPPSWGGRHLRMPSPLRTTTVESNPAVGGSPSIAMMGTTSRRRCTGQHLAHRSAMSTLVQRTDSPLSRTGRSS